MTNLHDILNERQMYDSSVEAVTTLLKTEPTILVELEDVVDYVFNIGHRHRKVEGWDITYRIGKIQVSFNANHYPERALFCTLGEIVLRKCRFGRQYYAAEDLIKLLMSNCSVGLFELEDSTLNYWEGEEYRAIKVLNENPKEARYIGTEFKKLENLQKAAQQFCVELVKQKQGDEEILEKFREKRIRLSTDYVEEMGGNLQSHVVMGGMHFIDGDIADRLTWTFQKSGSFTGGFDETNR